MLLLVVVGLAGCGAQSDSGPTTFSPDAAATKVPGDKDEQGRSLLGMSLVSPQLPDDVRHEREQKLMTAEAAHRADPADIDALIWVGRRRAYLGDYRAAIDIYSQGIAKAPENPRLYRHRGHRYITLRDFKKAIADLERARDLIANTEDEIEPDGLPNVRGIPTSTLHSNVYYHLGLAYYLVGDDASAQQAYRSCIEVARTDDTRAAALHWLYMSMRRAGRHEEASRMIAAAGVGGFDIVENHGYHRLVSMYAGLERADALLAGRLEALDDVTVAYGLARWYALERQSRRAAQIVDDILASNEWAAFGYIAAESDVHRSRAAAQRARIQRRTSSASP